MLRFDVDWLLFGAFLLGLAWVPYWEGSNHLMAWGINATLFPGLAVCYEITVLLRNERHPVALKELWLPATLLGAVLVWIVVQNASWTPNSWHHPIWAMAGHALDKSIDGSISVNRDLTTQALVRLLTAVSVFWLALQFCRNAARADWVVAAMAALGCAYAAYGLIEFASASGPVSWFGSTSAPGFVTSTFYNRNHYATYAGMGLIAICGLLFRHYRNEVTGGPIAFRIASVIEASAHKGAGLLGGFFLLMVTLLLTTSRGGLLATGLGLTTLALVWFGRRDEPARKRKMILQAFTIVFVVFILFGTTFVVFGENLLGKIAAGGVQDDNRIAVYAITLQSIFTAPLLGYGYGTFPDVFPLFRDHSIATQGIWQQAHDTYLEVFQGLGIVFGALLITSSVVLFWNCLIGALRRRQGAMVCCVATSAAVLVGIHSLVDFSLQIQAVTLTLMAFLGAGVAQSMNPGHDGPRAAAQRW